MTNNSNRRFFLRQVAGGALALVAAPAVSFAAAQAAVPKAKKAKAVTPKKAAPKAPAQPAADWRLIKNGNVIPSLNYSDQPYIVKADDGAWVCVMTTGAGVEGQTGQHVTISRSTDLGKTWSKPVALEPPDGPEASYAVLLKVPSGRLYCFYNHNTDNLRWVKGEPPAYPDGQCKRVDTQGYFVFKFSDDHGRNWSPTRTVIPVREMEIDRQNPYGGKVRYFWNVGRPFVHNGAAFVPLIKVGGFGKGFMTRSEGVLLRSANILDQKDPAAITWETLPEGDAGLRTPAGGGPIAEEQSYVTLSDGSFYAVYRTVDGHPTCAYSRDGGRTWSKPRYAAYADGRLIRHSRAANFAWKCQNGKFLYWFENHGGKSYEDRNPAWICGGVEADSPEGKVIKWSQPEVLLYDDNTYIRMSYPDLVEDAGRYFVTETEKLYARVHEIPIKLVEGVWGQFAPGKVAREGIVLELGGPGKAAAASARMPALPALLVQGMARVAPEKAIPQNAEVMTRAGFTIELRLRLKTLAAGQVVLDTRAAEGGLVVRTVEGGALEIVLNDSRTTCAWASDAGRLRAGVWQHVAITIDGGPHIITFVIDGVLCDGDSERQFGWGRFSPALRHANGAPMVKVGDKSGVEVGLLRVYNRALRTSEAVGNFKAG